MTDLVREDACRQAGDDLGDVVLVRRLQDGVVHEQVVPQKVDFASHVGEQAADCRGRRL